MVRAQRSPLPLVPQYGLKRVADMVRQGIVGYTLGDVIEHSFTLLKPAERILYKRLSVFAGGWDWAAMTAVCATSKHPAWSLLKSYTRLLNAYLITAAEDEGRWRMKNVIREDANTRLGPT